MIILLFELHKHEDLQLIQDMTVECLITELQAKLLFHRGIRTVEDANYYIYGDLRDLYSPFLLHDIDKAIDILVKAKKEKKTILVAGDYDTDGCTSISVSKMAFEHLGIKCIYHIPHRIKEGYGLSQTAIQKAIDNKCDIIYTVDNGISAVEEIKKAKELGIKVIVTDHHDIPKVLPNADAILNPKLKECQYPNKKLCGCSLTWKIMCALYERLGIKLDFLYTLLPMVAMATIGDMMDLDGENRILVREGLIRMNKNHNIGITMLKNIFKIDNITSEKCSFQIIPALNAAGRIQDAVLSAELLDETNIRFINRALNKLKTIDEDFLSIKNFFKNNMNIELQGDTKEDLIKELSTLLQEEITRKKQLAQQLYDLNEERKILTAQYLKECLDIIEEHNLLKYNVLVVVNNEIPEGIIGLVAGRLKEKFSKPVFVFAEGEGCYKGSGRGVENHPLSLFEGLQKTEHLWKKGGGHPLAAGVSFEKDMSKIIAFRNILHEYTEELLKIHPFTPKILIDLELDTPDEDICKECEILEPTGKNNPPMICSTSILHIESANEVGDGSHIRFKINSKQKGIGFSMADKYNELGNPLKLRFAYSPQINEYSFDGDNGKVTIREVQMMVHDIQKGELIANDNDSMIISSIKQSKNNSIFSF